MKSVTYAGAAVVVALLLAASGFAATPAGGSEFSPVPFDRTLSTGLTGVDVRQAETSDRVIPRAQVFYSQYEYVVGYYGLESLVAGLDADRRAEQFGQPLAIFVTDLSGTGPRLTEAGYLTLQNSLQRGWVRAEDAAFVLDSGARTTGGPTAVPFGDRAAAEAFADEYGGSVVDWPALRSQVRERAADESNRQATLESERVAWADETVEAARNLLDRPVSVVVGEDAPTLSAAIERAPPNTTVRVPAGTYETNVTVGKPLTLRGAGTETVVDGGGSEAVLSVESPGVGVADLRVIGAGDRDFVQAGAENASEWDRRVELVYGRGDAAIRFDGAPGSLVENVTVETPANGVVALNSDGTVVRETRIEGTDQWQDGSMSVLAMYSRLVVEDAFFDGGRDAVYTHYSDGVVVRDSHMQNLRYGVHEMYTSDTLIANNTVRNTDVGVIVMTRPSGNVLVDNHVRDSDIGVAPVGSASYTSRNVLVDNEVGLYIATGRSVYRHNTVVGNGIGVRSSTLLPTNDVYENDVVGNDRTVDMGGGTLNVWALEGRGNYWGPVPGMDRDGDGVVDRSFRPANAVDLSAQDSAAGYALANSPTVGALRVFQQAVPGLRSSAVVDPAPLSSPVRPDVLANATGGRAPP
jgi:nitrous oxidase accessory protein NosD/nitrous oxide reductase accessory protein NosL